MTKKISDQVQQNLGIRFYNPEDTITLHKSSYNKIIKEALRLFAEKVEKHHRRTGNQNISQTLFEVKKKEGIE